MNDFSVSEIAKKMRIADLLPRFDADESRLAIKLLHLVAIGHPVSRHLAEQTAEVESTCPATKASIHARITPDKVENIQPSAAVVSMVLPNQIGKTRDSAEIRNTFCCHVHFFVSQESAAEWIAVKNHDMKLLSVEDGFELGRLAFEHVLDHG